MDLSDGLALLAFGSPSVAVGSSAKPVSCPAVVYKLLGQATGRAVSLGACRAWIRKRWGRCGLNLSEWRAVRLRQSVHEGASWIPASCGLTSHVGLLVFVQADARLAEAG